MKNHLLNPIQTQNIEISIFLTSFGPFLSIFLGVTIDDQFTFGHVLLMQVVDIIFYGLLTWYIEGVFPGEYGIPKKFYFPFSKKYWCNVQDIVSC